jgi:hypothetical protein
VRALEVAIEVTCIGSGGPELARAVAKAWEWCADDERHEPDARLTVLLDDDRDVIATGAAGTDLFGTDLVTVMDRLSPVITRLVVGERAGR